MGCRLCNNASLGEKVVGEATEVALLEFVRKEDKELFERKYKRVFEQPFDSIRKRMTTVYEIDGKYECYTKGALEELLELCPYILKDGKILEFTSDMKAKILSKSEELSAEAYRILGFASKDINYIPKEGEDIESDLIFIGISCMIDPPREDVKKAIKAFQDAGIKVVMITGDHRLTAKAIALDLRIYHDGDIVMTGDELNKISDKELALKVPKVSVFARVAPEDKLRIVGAFKQMARFVR